MREVVCFDFATLAENRWMNSRSSALLFSFLVLLLLLTECQLRRFIPEAVVAGKQCHLVVVDIKSVGAYRVEEVSVVGRYNTVFSNFDR